MVPCSRCRTCTGPAQTRVALPAIWSRFSSYIGTVESGMVYRQERQIVQS